MRTFPRYSFLTTLFAGIAMLGLLTSCGDDEGSKDYSNYSFDSVQIQLPDSSSSGINIPLSCQADQDCFTDKPFCDLSLGSCVECDLVATSLTT